MWNCRRNYQNKNTQWLYWRDSVIFNPIPGPRFSFGLSFFPVQVKLVKVSFFTSTTLRKLETPFDRLFFDILLHAWSNFEFYHMLFNAFRIIIWNWITKTIIKMVGKGCDFITFVTFFIFLSKKLKLCKISRSSHNISNVLVMNELSTFSISIYCW